MRESDDNSGAFSSTRSVRITFQDQTPPHWTDVSGVSSNCARMLSGWSRSAHTVSYLGLQWRRSRGWWLINFC